MSSDDEKYLDSLLNSARSNNQDPQSALSRMSSKGVNWSDSGEQSDAPGDIGVLVDNANGNEDIAEIGDALNKLDNNEFVDDSLSDLLDDIEKPIDSSIPQFSVGGSVFDTRDPEEIALAEWLKSSFGGDIVLLSEVKAKGVKNPDCLWDNLNWEYKTISSDKYGTIDKRIHKAYVQIESNPGGMVFDFTDSELLLEGATQMVERSLKQRGKNNFEVIIKKGDKYKVLKITKK